MPEWLTNTTIAADSFSAMEGGWRLVMGLLLGGCVAIVYQFSHGRENGDSRSLHATLILLCALIAMVTMVIGGSVAKAFSLVGALSIVRFRTVVEDTRDTAFVIFSVIVGMAAGSGMYLLPVMGIVAIGGTAVALQYGPTNWTHHRETYELTIRLPANISPSESLRATISSCFKRNELHSVSTVKQGTQIKYVYLVQLISLESIGEVTKRLGQAEHVQCVELNSKP
ncbi:MAG: DUF4956 domain-containing protein [Pirellulaceae bacterium]|nr:DUF4956 domain-containing protein [Pirellulaceae bacterium]